MLTTPIELEHKFFLLHWTRN